MKIKEIRGLGINELQTKNRELAEELFRLKIRHASGQLESTATLGRIRKDIARIATVLKEKEAAG
ncbi:MAG: 50S ribosomal protein L29 [Deltaproteobacteria bacterium ADurb.Bin151]|jgi:large subunit ribosomal protein L29|nr:50S ribosomal protein L29 [Smithella sp.]OQB56407.1 MAG: 50S ribosomal protein L29 [Deltaproteobacteria bacterium ADurb.Bin151]HNZ09991.1 50S ribosomal protein L29 [Smithellaceae bacterium]HOQ40966.1 50S ribosomal protein L29 [Smithellaceae bacterium]HPL67622.1 50S ribosomal protein L29 [Smithellaceae bacterium]